jgi:VWFA-related protein
MRKNSLVGLLIFILAGLALAQQLAVESTVINIEVPVRVYKGGQFVDYLTINDFDIYEDGKLQKLEAVYLVKKRAIERRDELTRFVPQTNRNFYLLFEISDYSDKIGKAVDFFIQNVIMPGDTLTIVSPMATYRMKAKSFEALTREKITEQLVSILRRDALTGSAEYRSVIADLETLAKALADKVTDYQDFTSEQFLESMTSLTFKDTPFDETLNHFAITLSNLDRLRVMDQAKLLDFSKILKNEPGQKYVYLFYQREFVPKIEPRILYAYIERYQERPDLNQTIQGIFEFYRRDVLIDVEAVKQAYADSSVAIHFLLVTTPPRRVPGVVYHEQSEDIFSTFKDMAQATGGFTQSSADAAYLMKHAVESSENYYLLYYTPRPYTKDGKFREIVVKVKDKDCRVTHRFGYYAN